MQKHTKVDELVHKYEDDLIDNRSLYQVLYHVISDADNIGEFSPMRLDAMKALLDHDLNYSDKEFSFFEELAISEKNRDVAMYAVKLLLKYFKNESKEPLQFLLMRNFKHFLYLINNLDPDELSVFGEVTDYPITNLFLENYELLKSNTYRLANKNVVVGGGKRNFVSTYRSFRRDYAQERLVKQFSYEDFVDLERKEIESVFFGVMNVIAIRSYKREDKVFNICCLQEEFDLLFNVMLRCNPSTDNIYFQFCKHPDHPRHKILFAFFDNVELVFGMKCFRARIAATGFADTTYTW